jgi:hypothetical protein
MITAKQFLEWYTDNHKNASNTKVAEMLASLPSQERDTVKRLTNKTFVQRVENAAAADRGRKLERGDAWVLTDTMEMLDAMYGQGAGEVGKSYFLQTLDISDIFESLDARHRQTPDISAPAPGLDVCGSDVVAAVNDRSNR